MEKEEEKPIESKVFSDVEAATIGRRFAYQAEVFPLFIDEMLGDVPEGTWKAKALEIKERFNG